jgi:hypothetical protein
VPPQRSRKNILLEFSFKQDERDDVLRYCSLEGDIERRFRKIVAVGSDIIVVFDKPEANEMMNSISQAALAVSEDNDLKRKFDDLHDRFEAKYNDVFYR